MKTPFRLVPSPSFSLILLVVSMTLILSRPTVLANSPVTWVTGNINSPSDVATSGELIMAFNLGDMANARVINGVTFAADPGVGNNLTGNGVTVSLPLGFTTANEYGTWNQTGAAASYGLGLSSGRYQHPGDGTSPPYAITISSLIVGEVYHVQFWDVDERTEFGNRGQFISVRSNLAALHCLAGPHWAVATFMATNTTETITITPQSPSPGGGQLNLFQLRMESPLFRTATGTATLVNSFVTGVIVNDGGRGYTNTPLVRIVGGGGSGAQATAVVSNGIVTAINVFNAGFGYTNAPLVVIEPPFIPNPVLGIAPMTFLSFSNLAIGGNYQFQRFLTWYWTNQPVNFTATNSIYTQLVAGVAGSGDYRLAINPVPAQAFATPQSVNGFVVGATVTSGGSGYVTSPAVSVVGGGGSNATAVAQVSGGVVASVSITGAGGGYTNTPTIRIAVPPAAAVSPSVLPMMRVDSANLAPYDNYQIQFKADVRGTWGNWNGGLFSPSAAINSQYIFITNGAGFFRLQFVP